MNIGYTTFVNNNDTYIKLTDIFVESVLEFSKFNVEIFSINFDYKYKLYNDRIIYRRIDLPIVNFATICYSKLRSSYESYFDYGLQCDADMIITPDSDILFENCKNIIDTPLGSYHPSQFINNGIKQIMKLLAVEINTQPYLHATYLFSNSCKLFLKECYDISQNFLKKGINPINYDETIYNVMMWKYNKTNSYVSCYDPYYKYFLNEVENEEYDKIDVYRYICHGCKDIQESTHILEKIKNKKYLI